MISIIRGKWACGLLAAALTAQTDVGGAWAGSLALPNASLRLRVNLTAAGEGWKATLDSLDQAAMGIPVEEVVFRENKLRLKMPAIGAAYEATLSDGEMRGTFQQGGATFPLVLKRGEFPAAPKRPQLPQPPFPYRSEEVTFASKTTGVTLAGTLTLPAGKGPFPALALVTGSGPQDRDETILGHKPFWVIADYLARHGVAVLRYDDRGMGKSTGSFSQATTRDFALDAEGAFEFLLTRKEAAAGMVGLGGHSEGGLIAPMVAARRKDVAFVVMLAGPGVTGEQVLYAQAAAMMRASGLGEEAIAANRRVQEGLFALMRSGASEDEVVRQAKAKFGDSAMIEREARRVSSAWFREFAAFDPAPVLERVKCPVLVVNGELDLQVLAEQNVPAVEAALRKGGNRAVTVRRLTKVNHLLQTAEVGTLAESSRIEETVAPALLELLVEWLRKR